jgi:hypothetical protein
MALFFFPLPLWLYLLCWATGSGFICWYGFLWRREERARESAERDLVACAAENTELKMHAQDYATLANLVEDLHSQVEHLERRMDAQERSQLSLDWVNIPGLEDL